MSDLVGGLIVIAAVVLYFRFRRSRQTTRSLSRPPERRTPRQAVAPARPPSAPTHKPDQPALEERRQPHPTSQQSDPSAQQDEAARSDNKETQHSLDAAEPVPARPASTEAPQAATQPPPSPPDPQRSTERSAEETPAAALDEPVRDTEDAPLVPPREHRGADLNAPHVEPDAARHDRTPAERSNNGMLTRQGALGPSMPTEDRTGGRHGHDALPDEPGNAATSGTAPPDSHASTRSTLDRLHLATWLVSGNWVIGVALDDENRSRPIRKLADPVKIDDPATNETVTVTAARELLREHDGSVLAFALGQDSGRLARALRSGGNLVLVQAGGALPQAEHLTDVAPIIPSPLDGYEAFEVYVEDDVPLPSVAGGEAVVLPPLTSVPGFALEGMVTWPRVGNTGPTFSVPPIVVAADWSGVASLVVGEEAVGPRGWRKSLAISAEGASTHLEAHLHHFEAGWFFVRAYDALDRLIDSTQFQLMRGLHEVSVSDGEAGSRYVGPVRIAFCHDADIDIDGSAAGATELTNASNAGGSVWSTQFAPRQDVASFMLTRGGRTVRIDVPNEQVWWSLVDASAGPPVWGNDGLDLRGVDVTNAQSRVQLAVLPPAMIKNSTLRLVSQRGNGQTWRFARVPRKDHVTIWLRELGNAIPPRQPVDIDLELHVDSDESAAWGPVKIGTLTVQYECAYCGTRTERVEAMATHLHQNHWLELVREPPLSSLQRHFPNERIPRKILKCPHVGLDGCTGFLAPSYFDGDKTDEAYFEHLRTVHPGREHAVFVMLDLDEIRTQYLQGLPRLIECKKCPSAGGVPFATEITDEGAHMMMRHLIERHRPELWTMR